MNDVEMKQLRETFIDDVLSLRLLELIDENLPPEKLVKIILKELSK
jgi:hypothetical protein